MSKKETVVLLDAHAIIHRAYHALPDFSSSKGVPTGALYGVATMLMKIIDELSPDHVLACYDLPGGTFRNEISETYKANRKKADEALVAQFDNSRRLFEAFSVPIYEKEGYEADDVLGTIAKKLALKARVVIATGDMDTLQLVDGDTITVFTLRRGITDTVLYDEDAVRERFGFDPKFLADYKGLRGDPSDNIVGVRGIGEKTATKLITTYGTIEKMYAELKKDPDAFQKKTGLSDRLLTILTENEEEALFSKTLAQIITDVPIDIVLPDKSWRSTIDPQAVKHIFAEFEFRTLYDRFQKRFGIEEEKKVEEVISQSELHETAIALWLLNSELSNPSYEDILAHTKKDSFSDAKKFIFKRLKEEKLMPVFTNIEQPIIPIVQAMSDHGIVVNIDYFKELSANYHVELDEIEKKIFSAAGSEFNVRSPQQLSEILFEKLKLPKGGIKKSGATGAYSTRIDVLEKLRGEHEIINHIIDYRELQKLLSTYIDVIPNMVGSDGRLHATFLQHGTSTGRFSSSNPNLQNIPIRSKLGRVIREGFIAAAEHTFVAFDYSQIELRITAMLSGDEKLIAIFNDGGDIHAGVASSMFDVSPEEVTIDMRSTAKTINFGILYGMGVVSLQRNLGTSRKKAQEFYDNYFETFSGVAQYLEESKTFAREHGYTETLFGRRRQFSGINSRVPYIRASNERMAINAPIQGTQADIIKLAIKHVHQRIDEAGMLSNVHLILQIHDELIYEIKTDSVADVVPLIEDEMEHIFERSFKQITPVVPILVNTSSGQTWGALK